MEHGGNVCLGVIFSGPGEQGQNFTGVFPFLAIATDETLNREVLACIGIAVGFAGETGIVV